MSMEDLTRGNQTIAAQMNKDKAYIQELENVANNHAMYLEQWRRGRTA